MNGKQTEYNGAPKGHGSFFFLLFFLSFIFQFSFISVSHLPNHMGETFFYGLIFCFLNGLLFCF